MENIQQELSPIAQNQDGQIPMDEFEFKSSQKPTTKNIINKSKLIIFGLTGLLVLGAGILSVSYLLSSRGQTTQVIQATATPSVAPTPTEIPLSLLPPEYQNLDQNIQDYQKLLESSSETRSRLTIPIITLTVSF